MSTVTKIQEHRHVGQISSHPPVHRPLQGRQKHVCVPIDQNIQQSSLHSIRRSTTAGLISSRSTTWWTAANTFYIWVLCPADHTCDMNYCICLPAGNIGFKFGVTDAKDYAISQPTIILQISIQNVLPWRSWQSFEMIVARWVWCRVAPPEQKALQSILHPCKLRVVSLEITYIDMPTYESWPHGTVFDPEPIAAHHVCHHDVG